MKLKKYEIDAIVSKILNCIKASIDVPDFTEIIDTKEKYHYEITKLMQEQTAINDKINDICKKYNINRYQKEFDRELYKKQEINNFINSKLPAGKEIENRVILSNNKDLSAIIDEILEIYIR